MCHMKINVTEQSLQMEQTWTLVDSDGEEVSQFTANSVRVAVDSTPIQVPVSMQTPDWHWDTADACSHEYARKQLHLQNLT